MAGFFISILLFSTVVFVVALVRPQLFYRFKDNVSRKTLSLLFVGIAFASLVGIALTAEPVVKQQESVSERLTDEPAQFGDAAESEISSATQPVEGMQEETNPEQALAVMYAVVSVTDGDTFKVAMDGTTETVRLIGVDTPETVDPRKPVQCFGVEASKKTKATLSGKKVRLEADSSQGERDKYNRLLRYAYLEDGVLFNKLLIEEGYAHEYTYNTPYKYQAEFKQAQSEARAAKRGLWADDACPTPAVGDPAAPVVSLPPPTSTSPKTCLIKGNISTEKIYHVPGCSSYEKTVIDESAGERWFCTESEAVAAGWRKAKNCP